MPKLKLGCLQSDCEISIFWMSVSKAMNWQQMIIFFAYFVFTPMFCMYMCVNVNIVTSQLCNQHQQLKVELLTYNDMFSVVKWCNIVLIHKEGKEQIKCSYYTMITNNCSSKSELNRNTLICFVKLSNASQSLKKLLRRVTR